MSDFVQTYPVGSREAASELLYGMARMLSAEAAEMPKGSLQRVQFTQLTACVLDRLELLEGTDA